MVTNKAMDKQEIISPTSRIVGEVIVCPPSSESLLMLGTINCVSADQTGFSLDTFQLSISSMPPFLL